jgi:hypothetical protein
VRYLLHGDVLPELDAFHLPDVDIVMEPTLPVRQWRVINCFAWGPESWGMADYRLVLDQSAQRSLDDVLTGAAQRTGYPGGADRALQEVKGDIVALYFYD